jgi:hypothetical protein
MITDQAGFLTSGMSITGSLLDVSGCRMGQKKYQTLPLEPCQPVSTLKAIFSRPVVNRDETGRSLVIGIDLSPLGTSPQFNVIVPDNAGILARRFFSVVVLALGEDQIATTAEDFPASLLEQDPERNERCLVHAPLIRAAAATAVLCAVKGARVTVDGLEEITLWQDALATAREAPLVGVVDIVFQVALWGVLTAEQDLVGC